MAVSCTGLPALVYFVAMIAATTIFIIGTTPPDPHQLEEADVSGSTRRTKVNHIQELSLLLLQALKHVRGSKTSDNIQEALRLLNQSLCELGMGSCSRWPTTDRTIAASRNIIRETSSSYTAGTKNTLGKPLKELVTVILYSKHYNNSMEGVTNFIKSISEDRNNIKTIISIKQKDIIQFAKMHNPEITVIESINTTEGAALNRLIEHVETPFVLVARDMELLTKEVQLKRLVDEVVDMNVTVVAGATITPDGHWRSGCYQSAHKNYTLVYQDGYDESKHGCLFCDYTTSPFVSSTEFLKTHPFSDMDEADGLFHDWFLRVQQTGMQTIVCPDSMFHVCDTANEKINFAKLMEKWNLYRVVFPDKEDTVSKCLNISTDPAKDYPPTLAVHPCALQENENVISFISNLCEQDGLICEIEEGTNLGAVKFAKVLPWEYDGDMTYMEENYTAIINQHKSYSANGYRLWEYGTSYDDHMRLLSIGWLFVDNKMWLVEMYQRKAMDTLYLKQQGTSPTKVLFGNSWIVAPLNPGSFARNRYGREILRHVPHWRRQGNGTTGWSKYSAGTFRSCEHQGHTACLDQFNADGTLQFFFMFP